MIKGPHKKEPHESRKLSLNDTYTTLIMMLDYPSASDRLLKQLEHRTKLTAIPEEESCEWSPPAKKRVPLLSEFSCCHMLVNRERIVRDLPVLKRSIFLDDLARLHARNMADAQIVRHSVDSTEALQSILKSEMVGEDVKRGISTREMHRRTMDAPLSNPSRRNNLSKHFTEIGVGTAKGEDGKLYLCQLFRAP
jgi:hypothetical protein